MFCSIGGLRYHLCNFHTGEGGKGVSMQKYQCPYCGKVLTGKWLVKHFMTKHPDNMADIEVRREGGVVWREWGVVRREGKWCRERVEWYGERGSGGGGWCGGGGVVQQEGGVVRREGLSPVVVWRGGVVRREGGGAGTGESDAEEESGVERGESDAKSGGSGVERWGGVVQRGGKVGGCECVDLPCTTMYVCGVHQLPRPLLLNHVCVWCAPVN